MVPGLPPGRTTAIRAAPFILLLLFVFFILWTMDNLGPGW